MSERDDMIKWIKNNWFNAIIVIGVILNPLLSVNFVTKAEYEKDKAAQKEESRNIRIEDKQRQDDLFRSIDAMKESLSDISQKLAVAQASSVDKIQSEQLADHEARIRLLEGGRLSKAEH